MKIRKYAAIDIGSNAIRLLISNVIESKDNEPKYKKVSLVRVPIRLGKDVFTKGFISNQNKQRMLDAMQAFKLLMKVHDVEAHMACATSAMREAENGQEIALFIKQHTDIAIQIIDGATEAKIISLNNLDAFMDPNKSYLYVDVGGGSTELTFFSKGHVVASKSYKMGTVRLLDKNDAKATYKDMKKWILKYRDGLGQIYLIGSGGNINTIFKRSGNKPDKPLSYIYLKAHYQFLKTMSYEERISVLSLNPDRADVIIPATKIYLSTMEWSGATKVYVPKIGLSDGIIKSLYLDKKD